MEQEITKEKYNKLIKYNEYLPLSAYRIENDV